MGLDGKAVRVLLVEDEPTLMMVLEQAIAQVGYDVSKTAEDLPTALACAEEAAFDVAVLDVNLNGVESYPWPIAWSSWGAVPVYDRPWGQPAARPLQRHALP